MCGAQGSAEMGDNVSACDIQKERQHGWNVKEVEPGKAGLANATVYEVRVAGFPLGHIDKVI